MTDESMNSSHEARFRVEDPYFEDEHSDRLGHFAEKAGDYASWMDGKLRHIVAEHPVAILATMVAVGFVFGRLVSRRS